MSNTPCAYAVDSVLHRRVEIKVGSGHYGDDAHKRSLLSKEDSACRVLGTQ